MSARIANSIREFTWPEIAFKPKSVMMPNNIMVSIVPHLGQPDEAALFGKKLEYEPPVFEWLARYAPSEYDVIIEIGANVGLYTVFLDALIKKRTGSRLTRIISFEPSREAYRRLLENLQNNDVNAQHVTVFQAAVGLISGFQSFFEPADHICNGSLIREFANIFSDTVSETIVLVVGVSELEKYLIGRKSLIKIDVEGFEPSLVTAMTPLINKYHPDLLIEVLGRTVEEFNNIENLFKYQKFLITSRGLQQSSSLFVSPGHRDWLLRFRN